MSEPDGTARETIPEHLMLSRLAQSEQMREFFIRMWMQNPALARQGGSKVQNLLAPLAADDGEELRSTPSNMISDVGVAAVGQTGRNALQRLASKYVWWKTPNDAVAMPERVIAQVMNIGDYADVQELAAQIGDDALRQVLIHAEAGQFSERSWAYWHYRLGLAGVESVPAMPVRSFA